MATILVNLPNRPTPPKVIKERRIGLEALLNATSHVIHESVARVSCARCHNSFRTSDPSVRSWLSCKCKAIGSSSDRPLPLTLEDVHSGNRVTHHTHKLHMYRGLVYCNKCGCRCGPLGMKKLGRICVPPNGYGLASLCALREGKLPPNLSRWPDEPPAAQSAVPARVQPRQGLKRKAVSLPEGHIRLFRRAVAQPLVPSTSTCIYTASCSPAPYPQATIPQ